MFEKSNVAKETSKRILMKPTLEECAIEILEKAGERMSMGAIFDEVLKMRPAGGKTPRNTIYSVLYKSERIVRLGNGFFDLKERVEKEG